jgi:osmotically-inducible protein OsmY
MGRLVMMLLVALMTNNEPSTGKTARHNGDDAGITAATKAELAADQTASTSPKITVATDRCTVALNGNVGSVAVRQPATENNSTTLFPVPIDLLSPFLAAAKRTT